MKQNETVMFLRERYSLMMMILFSQLIQNQREILVVVTTLMMIMEVFELISQMRNEGAQGINDDYKGAQGSDNFAADGEGRCRSTRTKTPIERLVSGANNIKSYPKTVWKSDANRKLEHFNLWNFQQSLGKLAKLNRDIFHSYTWSKADSSWSSDPVEEKEKAQVQGILL
jgi:hypothetical protein